MEQEILEKVKFELINGYVKKRHPFRYFTLSTIHNNSPRQRTVVHRKLLDDFTVLFYTDKRSTKIEDLNMNNAVSALFYHPKMFLQVQISGKVEFITDEAELNNIYKNIPENSKKDYITSKNPSSEISNPDNVEYLTNKNYFVAVKIIPNFIEVLQLKRPNHIRIQYTRLDNSWNGQFLVP